jgi:hypothetical protein
MTTTTKRTYTAFPYLKVLTNLLYGKGYDATAKQFGYYEPEKADSTKSFRAHLHRARTVGFKYEDRIVKFPAFTRDGEPLFVKGNVDSLIVEIMKGISKRGRKPKSITDALGTVAKKNVVIELKKKSPAVELKKKSPVEKTMVADSSIGVKLIGMKTRGRRPNPTNSVVMVVDSSGKFLTLSVPKSKSMIQIDSLLEALSPLMVSQGSSVEVPVVETPIVVENVVATEQTHIEEQGHEESKTEPTVQAVEQTHDLALAMATE